MNVSNAPTAATVASNVWGQASRSVTTFYPPATLSVNVNNSLAANTSVNVQPAVNTSAIIMAAAKAGSAGTFTMFLNDGTNTFTITTIAASGSGVNPLTLISNGFFFVFNNNDATHAGTYSYNLFTVS